MVEITDSIAVHYHRETKYSPERLANSQHQLDWEHKPLLHKVYHQARKTDLTAYIPFVEGTIAQALETFPLEPLGGPPWRLEHVSRLLYFTNGVTRVVPHPGSPEPLSMRAAPSAGALYPTEIYLVCSELEDLEPGAYNFQVKDHSLITVWDGDFREQLARACLGAGELVRRAPATLVLTGLLDRSAWRYAERAYRRVLLDTGHVLGNAVVYASRVGLRAIPLGGFVDEAVAETIMVDIDDEVPLVVLPLLPAAEAIEPPAHAQALRSACNAVPIDATDDGIMRALHAASRIDGAHRWGEGPFLADEGCGMPAPAGDEPREQALEERCRHTEGVALVRPEPLLLTPTSETAILTRRSTRAFSGDPVERDQLARVLAAAYEPNPPPGLAPDRAIDPPRDFIDRTLIETWVIANAVRGIEPGAYYLAPRSGELRRVRSGNLREACHHFCLGQELGRDAAFVVVHTADLWRALTLYGDRAYRYVHLDAGHLGERLDLAALQIGLGASGIGGFFDDEVNELLGLPERCAVVYVTTIGKPVQKGMWV